MRNFDIREAIKKANLKHWQVAEALGISEYTMVKRLRHELSNEKKEEIFMAIKKLKKEEI